MEEASGCLGLSRPTALPAPRQRPQEHGGLLALRELADAAHEADAVSRVDQRPLAPLLDRGGRVNPAAAHSHTVSAHA